MHNWLSCLFGWPKPRMFTVLDTKGRRPITEYYMVNYDGPASLTLAVGGVIGRPHPILASYTVTNFSVSFDWVESNGMAEIQVTYEHKDAVQ